MTDLFDEKEKPARRKHVKKATYADARIFKLIDNTNQNVFIGGSVRDLCQRLANFKSKYKSYLKNKSNKYLLEYEILKSNNFSIELVEMCPCKNKDELNKQIYKIVSMTECINKNRDMIKIVNDINYAIEFDKIFAFSTSAVNQKPASELTRQEMIDILMKAENNKDDFNNITINTDDDDQIIAV